MTTHRRYTHAQKARAVAEASVNGVMAAEAKTGIRESTIRYWLDQPEFAELRAKTREEMRDGFKVLVHRAQERLTALVDHMEPRDLTVLLGVATDKTLLMSGDATARTETLTNGFDTEQQRRIREWLASVAGGEGDSGGTGDAVAVQREEGTATPTG